MFKSMSSMCAFLLSLVGMVLGCSPKATYVSDKQCDPETLLESVQQTTVENHFNHVFELGRKQASQFSLETSIACGKRLFESDFNVYLDGLAHEYTFVLHPIEQDIDQIRNLELSQEQRVILLDGLIAQVTQNFRGESRRILPILNKISTEFPSASLENGIRIGIRLSTDLEKTDKINLILEYPESMQGALIEEYGWDFGDHRRTGRKLRLRKIPKRLYCHYAHGFGRGLYLQLEPISLEDWHQFLSLSADMQGVCVNGFWLGVVRGVQLNQQQGKGLQSLISELPSEEHRVWMTNVANQKSSLIDEPIWDLSLLADVHSVSVLSVEP